MYNSKFDLVNSIYSTIKKNKILFKFNFFIIAISVVLLGLLNKKTYSQPVYLESNSNINDSINQSLDLPLDVINSSKVLQRLKSLQLQVGLMQLVDQIN